MATLVSAAEAYADGKTARAAGSSAEHPNARAYLLDMGYDEAEMNKAYSDAWYAALYFDKGFEAGAA